MLYSIVAIYIENVLPDAMVSEANPSLLIALHKSDASQSPHVVLVFIQNVSKVYNKKLLFHMPRGCGSELGTSCFHRIGALGKFMC